MNARLSLVDTPVNTPTNSQVPPTLPKPPYHPKGGLIGIKSSISMLLVGIGRPLVGISGLSVGYKWASGLLVGQDTGLLG